MDSIKKYVLSYYQILKMLLDIECPAPGLLLATHVPCFRECLVKTLWELKMSHFLVQLLHS